jgi:hypothetical protein
LTAAREVLDPDGRIETARKFGCGKAFAARPVLRLDFSQR